MKWSLISLLAVILSLGGCERRTPDKTGPADDRVVDGVERVRWAGTSAHTMKIEWVSIDGRFILAWIFDEDTDGSGAIEVSLGQHGEAEGDSPNLRLIDTRNDTVEALDAVAGLDEGRVWLVARRAGVRGFQLLNARTGTWVSLGEGEAEQDANLCLGPRSTVLESGKIARILPGDREVEVFEARAPETVQTFHVPQRVWRARPSAKGWVRVFVVDGEFPRAKTTCSCTWCAGLATSIGHYGWDGGWQEWLVRDDGVVVESAKGVEPLSREWLWNRSALVSAQGEPRGLPEGCALREVRAGSPWMLLTCGSDVRLWNVDDGSWKDVDDGLRTLNRASEPRLSGLERRLVRVVGGEGARLGAWSESSRLVTGPRADRVGSLHPSGWVLGATRDALVLFNVESGAERQLDGFEAPPVQMEGLSARALDHWWVFDPERGLRLKVDREPVWVTDQGCTLRAVRTRPDGLVEGPLSLVCIEARPK